MPPLWQYADWDPAGRPAQAWHVQGQGLRCTSAPQAWGTSASAISSGETPQAGDMPGCAWRTQQQLDSGSCALQVSPCPPQPLHTALGRPTAARNSSCTQCCLRGTLPGWLHLLQGLLRMLRPESLSAGTRRHLLQGLLPLQEQCWWLRLWQGQLLPPRLAAAEPAPCPLLQQLLPAWLPRSGQLHLMCARVGGMLQAEPFGASRAPAGARWAPLLCYCSRRLCLQRLPPAAELRAVSGASLRAAWPGQPQRHLQCVKFLVAEGAWR